MIDQCKVTVVPDRIQVKPELVNDPQHLLDTWFMHPGTPGPHLAAVAVHARGTDDGRHAAAGVAPDALRSP